ncbi:SGNH/GDSL hydrolase family protein [Agreia sp. COWG]|uniref:SGNH/GDSL hydrolase family protein n=1 Tax=Agreia sp. COWG TaxID=2773266 RepID=UPI0019292509|nr:SGNH/GDSL hydrolase family protein [Agreia sp. COWG]
MARKPTRLRLNGRRFGRAADYIALAIIAVAAIVLAAFALSGVSLRPGVNPDPTSRPAPTAFDLPTETPTATPTTSPAASVLLLGDQNSAGAESWWAQSIGASKLGGVQPSAQLGVAQVSESPVTVTELQQKIDATTSLTGYVIVQAGSTDIANGVSSAAIAAQVENLWKAVTIRGATPIVALVPPSDDEPETVVAVNDALKTAAATAGYGVLDLNASVASTNGTWATGFSDDGVVANAQGSRALADAVVSQLPALVQKK